MKRVVFRTSGNSLRDKLRQAIKFRLFTLLPLVITHHHIVPLWELSPLASLLLPWRRRREQIL